MERMKSLDVSTVAKSTLAAGITAVLATFALLGFFGGSGFLGGIGDLMDVLNSILVIPLFILMGHLTRSRHQGLGRAVQTGGAAGALMRLAGAFLIFSQLMAFEDAVLLVNAGMGLMGMALLIFLLAGRAQLNLSRVYYGFSLIVGLAMAVNILGVFLYDAYAPLLQGEAGFADLNPLLLALLVFAPVQILGYPIWLLWTGRLLLKSPDRFMSPVSRPAVQWQE